MYMVDHDIVLIADIATPTNWTRHRGPFAYIYIYKHVCIYIYVYLYMYIYTYGVILSFIPKHCCNLQGLATHAGCYVEEDALVATLNPEP